MKLNISLIPGDGIGPEIITAARHVLDKVAATYDHELVTEEVLLGGASIDAHGKPLTDEAIAMARQSSAVLMGAIGGDAATSPWYQLEPGLRPEAGLLGLRKALGLFANLRPAFLYDELKDACPLRTEIARRGFDMLIVRELTGGLYFGERKTLTENGVRRAYDSLVYDENEIRRVAAVAFSLAGRRKSRLVSVDKANVLDSSRLWRTVVEEVATDYPDVALSHMLVDNCAMQLVREPAQFDVILTENMFGDILSDEAAMITGSIGMLPSASLSESGMPLGISGASGASAKLTEFPCAALRSAGGASQRGIDTPTEKSLLIPYHKGGGNNSPRDESRFGLYEPCHGSAPDIAGKDVANPLATILSAAMMLRLSFGLETEAAAMEATVKQVLAEGYRTADIHSGSCKKVGCKEMGELVCERI